MIGPALVLSAFACVTVSREVALDRRGPGDTRIAVERSTVAGRKAPAVEGTLWRMEAELPDLGAVSYELRFGEAGRLESMSPRDVTPYDDSWSQDGNKVVLRMNDNFAVYNGVFIEDGRIEGEASNELGAAWDWSLERVN